MEEKTPLNERLTEKTKPESLVKHENAISWSDWKINSTLLETPRRINEIKMIALPDSGQFDDSETPAMKVLRRQKKCLSPREEDRGHACIFN